MIVTKNLSLGRALQWTGHHLVWLTAWAGLVAWLRSRFVWLSVPWLPVSLIGTAVAFYIGFKNNSAYDRTWEARKIWGGIVNTSRAWASAVRAYVTDQFAGREVAGAELQAAHRDLIYRHIAWLYQLRAQLLQPEIWEHAGQSGHMGRWAAIYQQKYGIGLFTEQTELEQLLSRAELDAIRKQRNPAAHLIDAQAMKLRDLRRAGLLEDFRHMELQNLLHALYEHQGKCERIKKFPLPRQYAGTSVIFVGLFILLLPLGLASEFARLGEMGVWLSVPLTVLVSWIYLTMDLVGDYSEFPFHGLASDIPMLTLCRTIELDLRAMLGEESLPPPIAPINGVLM